MRELHIHDVLRMMMETQKTYNGKMDFVRDINEIFGTDVNFYACSGDNMDAHAAFDFLIARNKININTEQTVSLDPNMTMCDENGSHDHDHDHNHHH